MYLKHDDHTDFHQQTLLIVCLMLLLYSFFTTMDSGTDQYKINPDVNRVKRLGELRLAVQRGFDLVMAGYKAMQTHGHTRRRNEG